MASKGYDPIAHAYTIDGVRVPSVTQALEIGGFLDKRFYTGDGGAAVNRGRRVHAVTMSLDMLKTLRDQDVDPEIGGEVEAYRSFLRDRQPVWESIERAFWCVPLRYGGRPDRTFRKMIGYDVPGTVELKTGSEASWHGIQLAGYQRGKPRGARMAVYLGKNGRFKLVPMNDPLDHSNFLYAIQETWRRWTNDSGRK